MRPENVCHGQTAAVHIMTTATTTMAMLNSSLLSPPSLFPAGGDFYFYSGLIRPVVVSELPSLSPGSPYPYFIDSVAPLTIDYTRGLVDIRVTLGGNVSGVPSVHLSFGFNGAAPGASAAYAVVGGVAVIPSVPVPNFKLWAAGVDNTAALFTVTVVDGATKDAVTARSGVRQVAVDAATARITINGQAVKMVGFNRHTMVSGHALLPVATS